MRHHLPLPLQPSSLDPGFSKQGPGPGTSSPGSWADRQLDLCAVVKAKESSLPEVSAAFLMIPSGVCRNSTFSLGQLWMTASHPRGKES